jgi:hypothetical protein
MQLQKCPYCGAYQHAAPSANTIECWNCGATVLVNNATWDRKVSKWVDQHLAAPWQFLPLVLPLILLLILLLLARIQKQDLSQPGGATVTAQNRFSYHYKF